MDLAANENADPAKVMQAFLKEQEIELLAWCCQASSCADRLQLESVTFIVV
jgi:hypothetical protein